MKRGLPIIVALVVTLAPGVVALLLNTALGRLVAPEGGAPGAPGVALAETSRPTPSPVMPRGKTLDQYLDVLINRNLFDKTLHGTWSANPGGPGGGDIVVKLDVILLGTVVAEPETFSSALIVEKGREDWPKGYSVGDELFGHEIMIIEKKRVGLRKLNGREIEWLTMDDAPSRTTTSSPEPSGDGDEAVEQVSDNRFAVDRELFDKYINDIESISRMGRALLHRGPDGEFDGYRLSAIRRNTLADQLGIKNGDVVHSVNGTSLDSVQSAMNAYQTMQNEQNFCFEITRRGQPVELCYDVQ